MQQENLAVQIESVGRGIKKFQERITLKNEIRKNQHITVQKSINIVFNMQYWHEKKGEINSSRITQQN